MAWFRALAEADSQAAEAQERCNELAAAVAAAERRAAGAEAAREAAEQDLQREVQRWKLQAEAALRAAKLMDHSSSASARETPEEVNDLRQHVGDVVALYLGRRSKSWQGVRLWHVQRLIKCMCDAQAGVPECSCAKPRAASLPAEACYSVIAVVA